MLYSTKRTVLLSLAILSLASCTAAVSDVNGFNNYADACDGRGVAHLGEDLDIQFINTTAHINQDMRFSVEVGTNRNIEAMFIVSSFNNSEFHFHVPEVLPAGPSTLSFWADSNDNGVFDDVSSTAQDHQWFRPICPDGHMTFTHTTPFQDISQARSSGLIWTFEVPMELRRHELFDTFAIAAWAVRTNELGRQTRVYFLRQPYVAILGTTPPQRTPPAVLKVGGNVGSETRGAIDSGETYEVNFVIDVDQDGELGSRGDYACQWADVVATANTSQGDTWDFTPPGLPCDVPPGFDPLTFMP